MRLTMSPHPMVRGGFLGTLLLVAACSGQGSQRGSGLTTGQAFQIGGTPTFSSASGTDFNGASESSEEAQREATGLLHDMLFVGDETGYTVYSGTGARHATLTTAGGVTTLKVAADAAAIPSPITDTLDATLTNGTIDGQNVGLSRTSDRIEEELLTVISA